MLVALLLVSTAGMASEPGVFPWKRNADAIVAAIQNGSNLSQTGLAGLLHEDELAALGDLEGCSLSSFVDATKNFAATNWTCGSDKEASSANRLQRTVAMRFRDDGSLFALSINPLKSNFTLTELGAQRTDWPSQEASAKAFAKAVSEGGDASLGAMVPLTSLQVTQFARLSDSRWKIIEHMSEAEKRRARSVLGENVVFAERPKNGVEIVFSSKKAQGLKDKMVTLYFDNDDRAVGLHIEDSLLAVTTVPERR